MHPGRGRHVLVDDLVDACGDLHGVQSERFADGGGRGTGRRSIERHVAAEERVGVEHAQHHVGVGDRRARCRRGRTTPGPARHPPTPARPSSSPNWSVRASEPPPAPISTRSTDGHRAPGTPTLLEAVGAGDLEHVGEFGFAVVDQAGLGGGAAHVEAQQPVLAEPLGEPACRRARRPPGRSRPDGSGCARRRRRTRRRRSTAS